MEFQILEKVLYNRDDKRRLVLRHGDKVLLPEKILHELVDLQKAVGVEKLPHPLVFRISTPSKSTYVGVKEFHAEDDTSVFLTDEIVERLSIDKSADSVQLSLELALRVSGLDDVTAASIGVRPLEKYTDVKDWKTFLESTISERYTAVTTGDVLHIDVDTREYLLRVEQVKTSNSVRTVCVVDRDIDLVVIGENEEEDTVKDMCGEKHGFVPAGHVAKVCIAVGESLEGSGMFAVGDEFVGSERFECASMGDLKVGSGTKFLYAFEDLEFNIGCVDKEESSGSDRVRCQYCDEFVSIMSQRMHENFCQRNNVRCDECGKVFFKQVPATHWHCCEGSGDSELSLELHVKYMHLRKVDCLCGATFDSLYACSVHSGQTCPRGLHECRFCHLIVPRGDLTTESRYYGLSGHEASCGSKTIECGTCGKRVKVRDAVLHEEVHRRDMSANVPYGCTNVLCPQLQSDRVNVLGLCEDCFAPLYSNVYDPDGKKLRARLERRYILMMKNGCGDKLCDNELCCTGESMVDIVNLVKKLDMKELKLCVDEKRRLKMKIVKMFENSGWSKGWIIRGLEECKFEIDKVLPWLSSNIINKG